MVMTAGTASRLAWGLWAGYLGVATLMPLLIGRFVLNPGYETGDVFGNYWLVSVVMLPFVSVGALIAARRPENRIGWLILAGILSWNPGGITEAYRMQPAAVDGTPLAGWIIWADYWISLPGMLLVCAALPLLFPTGRLPSPRWRPVGWLAVFAVLVTTFVAAFGGEPASDEQVPDVVRSETLASWISPVEIIALIVISATLLGTVASLLVRFRRARGIERQQLKWFAFVAVVILMGLLVAISGWPYWEVGWYSALFGVTVGLPVVIGLAILRYRLYAIDRIINRALVYGSLTVGLAGVYVGLVVLAQRTLGPVAGESDLAIAASTLAVAALFRPARSRIQRTVDRRFFRRKYDAARTVDVFSARLRDEVDLDTLVAELQGVVQETMQPAHVTLWLRPGPLSGRDATGDARTPERAPAPALAMTSGM
jgi:hypothetical protein